MSQNTETVAFRTRVKVAVSNFLQKYRSLLLGIVVAGVVIIGGLAIWTQVDASTKVAFAEKIEKSEADYTAWVAETDAAKKAELGKALEAELTDIQKSAPQGYGLAKSWYILGTYRAAQSQWKEAAEAYRAVFDKDHGSYLAPVSLVNAAVSLEEAADPTGALKVYAEFDKAFPKDPVLGPQVLFTMGRLHEAGGATTDAVASYRQLLDRFPESSWTKLGRDRILLLSQE